MICTVHFARADLAVSAKLQSIRVSDPKLAVLFTITYYRGLFNLNISGHTEGDRLVSCVVVKNAFKVGTLRTFESGATPRHLWSPTEGRQGDCLGEVCHSCLKICKSLNTGPVSLLSLETLQLARFMKSMGRLVTLSLSLVLSASALLISHLDRKKSLDNNKSMGFGEASAGSAVGLGSVYHWLQKKKKKVKLDACIPGCLWALAF